MVTCHALSGLVMPLRRRAAAVAAHAARKTVGAGLMALAVAAVLGVAGFGPAGCGLSWVASANAAMFVPDPVFAGTLTAAQQTEMKAWGQAYFNKIEGVNQGGGNAVATAWTFSTPAMNSPLFNPFYGPRQTLVNLALIADTDCPRALTEATGADAVSQAKRGAIKDALVNFAFKTDPVSDPNGTITHVYKILDASLVSGLVTYTEGGKLVSEKLPLDIIIAAGANSQLANSLSETTINAINAIVVAAPSYAQNTTGLTETRKLLTGGTSKTDNMELLLENIPSALGIQAKTAQLLALFGVYGQLPLIQLQFADAMILVDAINGSVAGPFQPGSMLDASGLVASHVEASGTTGIQYVAAGGCPTVNAGWVPAGGPGGTIPAGWPRMPATPTMPPGRSPGWTCSNIGASCVCQQQEVFGPPAALPGLPGTIPAWVPAVTIRTTCTWPGGCFGPANIPPTPTPPATGPAFPPAGPSPLAPTCTGDLFRWW